MYLITIPETIPKNIIAQRITNASINFALELFDMNSDKIVMTKTPRSKINNNFLKIIPF